MSVNAQWVNNTSINTEVSTYADDNMDIQSVELSDGRTAVVFWQQVAAPTNYELRMQIMSKAGVKTLGSLGVLISDSIPMSTYTNTWSLVRDSSNHIYIGVTGTDGNIGMAFKVDTLGNHLWPSSGINLGSGFTVKILPLSTGNAAVSWMSGTTGISYLQQFDNSGNAVWTNNINLATGWYTVPANLFELSNGDIVSIFHKRSYGINSTLYAQRFTTNGASVWSQPTQLSTKTTAYNYLYSPAQNNDTCYLGYVGKSNNRFDSYIQRINPDGTTPWGANGLDFDVNTTSFEMDIRIAIEGESPYLWAMCTYTNSNQSQKGEYVQKINMFSGTRLLTNTAKSVFPIGSEYTHVSKLLVYDDEPIFLLQKGTNNGVSATLLDLVKLNSVGDFLWSDTSKAVASKLGTNKGRASINNKVNDQIVVVFVEAKDTSSTDRKIYAQNFLDTFVVAQSSDAFMLTYRIPGQISSTIYPNDSIVVVMPASSIYPISSAAEFTVSPNANAFIGTTAQDSGLTMNTWNDSLTPVIYNIVAEDGVTTKQYPVYVKIMSTIGISEAVNKNQIVFNNPISNSLNINSLEPINNIKIINTMGETIFEQQNIHEYSIKLNTSMWEKGLYILILNSNNVNKIIKN
ncbi:MAG: hypothetical protein DSY76_05930 [Bacteroidetes bacterium]|nr:MAG: hypothetical protein DSY76_05930 [Bacteroidota bacterium]